MLSERVLRKWRKEALHLITYDRVVERAGSYNLGVELSKRILKLTQELLDQHLIRR